MRHGSLFSGVGGFDLAAEWMGWENVFHCEWNEFGKKVLNYYWHKAISYHDITKTDFTIHRGTIDILTGGFPCQPYSTAGKRKGKDDERHLWPEMLRAIQEIQPTWIVGENVSGLINWNGGVVFDEVQTDLEAQRYEVIPFVLPAAGVNAPHRRDRVWLVAYSDNARAEQRLRNDRFGQEIDKGQDRQSQSEFRQGGNAFKDSERNGCVQRELEQEGTEVRKFGNVGTGGSEWFHLSEGYATSANSRFIQDSKWQRRDVEQTCFGQTSRRFNNDTSQSWGKWPTQSPICNGDDGISTRLDNITFPKWRNESIKAGGNAIVPQVALQIFKAIEQFNEKIN